MSFTKTFPYNTGTLPRVVINPPQEVTFEANLSLNLFTLLLLLTGKNISNNYLKIHGGILQRRRQIERLRKRR